MADTLNFSLVSPAKELFSGEVEQVIAPGTEGQFGVLPRHAPFMTTLKNGVVQVLRGAKDELRIFVRGGFADVTPAGLTILAEEALDLQGVDASEVDKELEETRLELKRHDADDGAHVRLEEHIAYLEDLRAAL
ncbi:MAG: F0F1 ATP synthase subunit epsilon [Pseudomonadota bacterium]